MLLKNISFDRLISVKQNYIFYDQIGIKKKLFSMFLSEYLDGYDWVGGPKKIYLWLLFEIKNVFLEKIIKLKPPLHVIIFV